MNEDQPDIDDRPCSFDFMVRQLRIEGYEWGVVAFFHETNPQGQTYSYQAWISDPKRVTKSGNRRPWNGARAETPHLALWDAYKKTDDT